MVIDTIHQFKKRTLVVLSFLMIAALLMILITQNSAKAAPQVFTVTNTNAAGAGSLSQAVIDANSNNNPLEQDTISFDIPDSGTVTITPGSTIQIEEPVLIDGYTQSDATPNTALSPYPFDGVIRVEVYNDSSDFIQIASDNVTIKGLAISSGATGNIHLQQGSDNFKLYGNFLDTEADGLTFRKTNTDINSLVIEDSADVEVGGPTANQRNLFANCSRSCIQAEGAGTTNLQIKGNYIGLGSDGLTSLDNFAVGGLGGLGIEIHDASNVQIGGETAAEGNNIERNYWGAILAEDSSNIRVLGNRILFNYNFDVHGNGKETGGIYFGGVTDSIIGSEDGGNLISGNRSGAVKIGKSESTDEASSSIRVEYNKIGVMDDGNTPFGNTEYGVLVQEGVNQVRIANNTIAHTKQYGVDRNFGVEVEVNTEDISILQNSIFDSFAKGIENRGNATPVPMYSELEESGGNTIITYSYFAPAGEYRIEFFANNELDDSGMGEGQTPLAHQDITSTGSYQQRSFEITGTGYQNISLTATPRNTETGIDGFGTTSEFGGLRYQADLEVETTDGIEYVAEDTQDHEITQTITNLGPSSIDSLDFTINATDCYTFESVGLSGTAADQGIYNENTNQWSGLLESGQSLALTFTGDVTGCTQGDTLIFNHTLTMREYNGTEVNDYSSNNDQYSENTSVVTPVDLQFETTDGIDTILTTELTNQVTQTITNLSNTTVTKIDFQGIWLTCGFLEDLAIGGTAANLGSYDQDETAWEGELAPNETLVFSFNITLGCNDQSLILEHNVDYFEADGVVMQDLNQANNDYYDATDIRAPVTDFELTQTVLNPGDITAGAALNIEFTFTNHGPQSFDVGQFAGQSPGLDQLWIAMLPPEVDYISFSSSDNLECSSFGPGSASMFGSSMANHSNYTIVMCYDTTGSEHILTAGQSVSGVMQVEPSDVSDTTFTSYAVANGGDFDPSNEVMAGLGGSDIIDYLRANWINNFSIGGSVVDVSISKMLAANQSVAPGKTISYEIGLTNKGPMDFELDKVLDPLPMITDIYPGSDLTFANTSSSDLHCQDFGPGSSAYMGAGAINHPNHQLLVCAFVGSSRVIKAGETYKFNINFVVNNTVSNQFTNYISAGQLSTDPDVALANQAFTNATSDILDTFSNENFAKHTYVNQDNLDSDGDGVQDGIEKRGPNNGDANNDGILDAGQPSVASFISPLSKKTVVLTVADKRCRIVSTSVVSESQIGQEDPSYDYPVGLMNFTLQCDRPGITTRISQMYYDEVVKTNVVRKYYTNSRTYDTIKNPSMGAPLIDGKNVLTLGYQLTDGGELDMDGAKNGTIVDPAGVAKKATPATKSSTSSFSPPPASVFVVATALGIGVVLWGEKLLVKNHYIHNVNHPKHL